MKNKVNVKWLMTMVLLLVVGVSGAAQSYRSTMQNREKQQVNAMRVGSNFSGTIYKPFDNTAPSAQSGIGANYAPAQAPSGPNRALGHGTDAGNRSNEMPVGEPWVMVFFAMLFGGLIALRQQRNRTSEATKNNTTMNESYSECITTLDEQSCNHPVITPLSPSNHPLLHANWKHFLTILLVLFVGVGEMWGGTRTVYISCERLNWGEADAHLWINNAHNLTGAVQFTKVTGESSVYSAEVNDTWTSVWFMRYNSADNSEWASFSATLSETKNCGVPYYNENWNNGYMGTYFPSATRFYVSSYQTNKKSSTYDFSNDSYHVWVYYYWSETSHNGQIDVTNTSVETIDGHKTYTFELPAGTWDGIILVRTSDGTFGWNDNLQTGNMSFELGKNKCNNGTWSKYAAPISSATLTPATAYSGAGTAENPFLVSPGAEVTVNATATCPVNDGNMTVKYAFANVSDVSLQSEAQSEAKDVPSSYTFEASSTPNTVYTVKVTARNHFNGTSGTSATSSVVYFKVSATPAVALAVSNAGPVASGTELTLTATPSNTSATPTYSYYYKIGDGSYNLINTTPTVSATQTFTPAVNSPGTYTFKVTMHHSGSNYDCTSFPTTDVQQRRTISVKNQFTDLYGIVTTENASTATVTGIYNTLAVTRDEAPDGYEFAGWSKSSSLSFVSGNASASSTSVTMSAGADEQTLTALYTAKKRIYFDNTMSQWQGDIYVYMLKEASWWETKDKDKQGPGLVLKNSNGYERYNEYGRMTRIGSSNIYYYEYTTTPTGYVAFTKGDFHSSSGVYQTSAVYRSDFNECFPMYIASQGWETTNSTGFHNSGYWKRYNTTVSGFTLYGSWDTDNDGNDWDEDDAVEFTSIEPNSNTFKAKIHLNNTTHQLKIYRCYGDPLGNTGTMTSTNHSGWEMTVTDNCRIEAPAGGDYEFTLNLGSDHIYLSVEYPLLENDYHLLYTGRITTAGSDDHKHASQSIRHITEANAEQKDTVSFFIDKDHVGTLKIQKCSDPGANGGKGSWTDSATVTIPTISETGIYSFVVTQTTDANRVRTVTVAPLAENFKYTGNLYIRTDVADGGWEAYKEVVNNKMIYSDYAKTHSGYDYYHVHFTPTSKNLHFTIANDYSPSVSDTMTTGSSPFDFDALPYQASVRFMYNSATNKLNRAYVNGSSEGGEATYLWLQGNSSAPRILTEEGEVFTNHQAKFEDKGNWIYQLDIKAEEGAEIKLVSNYYYSGTQHLQYFKGSAGEGEQIIGGSSSSTAHPLRIVYDFKTNNLVSAWMVPTEDNSPNLALNADVIVLREAQGDARQITFAETSHSLSEVDTVYAVMQFNKWTLNNKETTGEHADVISPLTEAERNIYWISFPFNVKLSDVFGFGTYGTHWGIEYYDGKERAQKGYWADSEGFWKLVSPEERKTFTMEANVGYLLVLDLDLLGTNSSVWEYVEDVSLYFPSDGVVGTIKSAKNKIVLITQTDYRCSIDRRTDKSTNDVNKDRRIADSYWHCIGVPSFANSTRTDLPTSEATDPLWTSAVPYLYVWNGATGTYTVTSSASVTFKPMYAYMVQYSGATIEWTSVVAPSSVKARTKKQGDYKLRLELQKGEDIVDQTFIHMSDKDGISNNFEFNYDLFKEMNAGANIYTLVENYLPVAANCMPFNDQTSVIPVGVKIADEGEYTFAMPEGTNGTGAVLVDNIAGTRTNLGLTDYTVTLGKGTYDGRFVLELSPVAQTPTGIGNVQGDNVQSTKARKVMIDGIMYIVRDGEVFDARGTKVK